MSAKHKRPFYVFAAVAAVCGMVLFTGVRGSKADDAQTPLVAESQVADAGPPLSPVPDAPDAASPGSAPGATGGEGTDVEGDFELTTPGPDGSLTDADGGDAESGSHSGVSVLPPFEFPPPVVVDPIDDETLPDTDEESDDKGHRGRGKNKDKGKDKGKDKDEDESAEAEADAESDDEVEVDPDVYEVPEGDQGGESEGPAEEAP